MPASRSALLPALAFALATANLQAADFSAWTQHADLYLTTATLGIPSTLIGFPMVVRLDRAHFDFTRAQADGRDIRFAKPDGTPLPHEIEAWDSRAGTAAVWVRLDTLYGSSDGQSIRMYYGNPAASDASAPHDVFDTAAGFVGAWHLGGAATANRPNAVAGGNAAVPKAYDGDENVAGVIGAADSLDGDTLGDYLDLGAGYADFSTGFSFSMWIQPTAALAWARMIDLGNGMEKDNIVFTRVLAGDGVGFHNFEGTVRSVVEAPGQIEDGKWQLLSVSVEGRTVRIYKNGGLVLKQDLINSLEVVRRTSCFLGRSNWTGDFYYRGKLDEPELARAARNDSWMKLLWLNQRPGPAFPSFTPPCPSALRMPSDTAADEGTSLTIAPLAPCASAFAWALVSGPSLRILDPDQKDLSVRLPRVSGDTVIAFRLTASFPDSTRSRTVRIRVRETRPDPFFTLPSDATWNGRAPLYYRYALANQAALSASGDTVLNASWTLGGPAADTVVLADGLRIESAKPGTLTLRLCLDNGGAPVCHEGKITVVDPSGLAALRPSTRALRRTGRDALGRQPSAAGGRGALARFERPRAPRRTPPQ